jgi:two-component system NtrC family sensor kinase
VTVRARLLVIVVGVALVPLALSGLGALHVHQRAYDDKLRELHQSRAEVGATRAQQFLDRAVESLQLLVGSTIRWSELSDEERHGALALVYQQEADVVMATLLDGRGQGMGEAVFRHVDDDGKGPYAGHPAATMEALSAFAHHIPFAAAQHKGGAFGTSFRAAGQTAPILPLALSAAGAHGERWVVAVGLSLAALCTRLSVGEGETRTLLVDDLGAPLCGAGRVDAPEMLTARAKLGNGWEVVSQEPRATAFAASRDLARQSLMLLALSLAVALTAGLLLARRITRPVRVLTDGARELGRGNFQKRLNLPGADELALLGAAFDQMSDEVEKRDVELQRFNAELQQRVEERTRELKDAQAQLLQSQKIAAVSSLGAGIAHEINNPLTSVLGFAQILKMRAGRDKRADDEKALAVVESEAQRIKQIVQTLLTFSQSYAGESFTELDANQLLELAVKQVPLGDVQVVRELAAELPQVVGNPAQLQEAIIQLLKNAVTAMKGRGKLTLRTTRADGLVTVEVADTGKGIAPEVLPKIFDPFFTTKDDWRGEGLGLTLVHRIVEQHHGRIRANSVVGQGSTFTLTLPAATRRAHLL